MRLSAVPLAARGGGVMAPLLAARRAYFQRSHACRGTPPSPPSPGVASSRPAQGEAVVADDSDAWLKSYVDKAVASGRQTPQAAAYFESILDDQPEFRQGLQEARRLLGGQNPEQFTQYQQGQFADRLTHYMSGVASQRLMRAHAEEANTKKHTQDGSPTGENYWFEAGNTLASPGVPGFVKDEILKEMRDTRPADSPAFDEPRESEFLAADDVAYAQHMRDKKRRLLDGADFGASRAHKTH